MNRTITKNMTIDSSFSTSSQSLRKSGLQLTSSYILYNVLQWQLSASSGLPCPVLEQCFCLISSVGNPMFAIPTISNLSCPCSVPEKYFCFISSVSAIVFSPFYSRIYLTCLVEYIGPLPNLEEETQWRVNGSLH